MLRISEELAVNINNILYVEKSSQENMTIVYLEHAGRIALIATGLDEYERMLEELRFSFLVYRNYIVNDDKLAYATFSETEGLLLVFSNGFNKEITTVEGAGLWEELC